MAFYFIELHIFRKHYTQELATLTAVIAQNCGDSVAQNRTGDATRLLASLGARSDIDCATIYLKSGAKFATFGTEENQEGGAVPPPFGRRLENGVWSEAALIEHEGAGIGTLFVCANMSVFQDRLAGTYYGLFAALAGIILATLALIGWLAQYNYARPIEQLSATATKITHDRDFSVRLPASGPDELGEMVEAFNGMLTEIEVQYAALRESEQRFRSIAEASPDAVIIANSEGVILTWNNAAQEMFGYFPSEILGAPFEELMPVRLHAAQLAEVGDTSHVNRVVEMTGLKKDGREFPIEVALGSWKVADEPFFGSIIRDLTARKTVENQLEIVNQQLMMSSRLSGMAEIATSVLHNVGNVLNSVNVSATLASETLRGSKLEYLRMTADLLRRNESNMVQFLTSDTQGMAIPGLLAELADLLVTEREDITRELTHLVQNVEHIKTIVAMQQTYARVSGLVENLPIGKLVDDAIQINSSEFQQHGIEVIREYQPVPFLPLDKHRILQILVNLFSNAKSALQSAPEGDRRVFVNISTDGKLVSVRVSDNGIGIAEENLTRIFQRGFTTKDDGHGFGLHDGANTAREIGGALRVESAGPGWGATFTLELPVPRN